MLELNANSDAAAGGDLISEGSEATFMVDVVETSQKTPVIVDFWAPWCGPCKTLGPLLEDAVKAAKGKVRMVKINVDEHQRIAAELRIQSIPTVYAFWQGQPVDGFQGAVPGSEITAFVSRLSDLVGDDGLESAVEAAEAMLAEGAAVDAVQTFAAVLGEEPENAGAYGGLIRAHLAADQLAEADVLLTNVPDAIVDAPEIEAARAQIDLRRQAENAGPVGELQGKVAADPANHQARFELAQALHAEGQVEAAVDELLEIFRQDRDWNDGAAKTQLFTIFDALPPQDPIALNGRRKLSSMIFV